jgi:hypothetical protein
MKLKRGKVFNLARHLICSKWFDENGEPIIFKSFSKVCIPKILNEVTPIVM